MPGIHYRGWICELNNEPAITTCLNKLDRQGSQSILIRPRLARWSGHCNRTTKERHCSTEREKCAGTGKAGACLAAVCEKSNCTRQIIDVFMLTTATQPRNVRHTHTQANILLPISAAFLLFLSGCAQNNILKLLYVLSFRVLLSIKNYTCRRKSK